MSDKNREKSETPGEETPPKRPDNDPPDSDGEIVLKMYTEGDLKRDRVRRIRTRTEGDKGPDNPE